MNDLFTPNTQLQNKADTNEQGVVIYSHPEAKHYQQIIEVARDQLAALEASYSEEKAKVDSINAQLFLHLRPVYQERDRLKILVKYLAQFLQNLLDSDEKSAEKANDEYKREKQASDHEYDSTSSEFEGKRKITTEESTTLKQLWKKLVRIFHPDKYDNDQQNRQTYELLTQAINHARDCGDIDLLESIAKNPQAFILKQGWKPVSLGDSDQLMELQALYKHLQSQILEVTKALDELKISEDYELYKLVESEPEALNDIISVQETIILEEIKGLRTKADQYENKIKELHGKVPF